MCGFFYSLFFHVIVKCSHILSYSVLFLLVYVPTYSLELFCWDLYWVLGIVLFMRYYSVPTAWTFGIRVYVDGFLAWGFMEGWVGLDA